MDARVYLKRLSKHLGFWLETDWPFGTVAYPGREVSWEEFLELKDS